MFPLQADSSSSYSVKNLLWTPPCLWEKLFAFSISAALTRLLSLVRSHFSSFFSSGGYKLHSRVGLPTGRALKVCSF